VVTRILKLQNAMLKNKTPKQGTFSNTPEAETVAAGVPPRSGSIDPVEAVRTIINQVEPVIWDEFLEKHYGNRSLLDKGKSQKDKHYNTVVPIAEHFVRCLNQNGMGAGLLNATPHFYVCSHWQIINKHNCSILLGELAERLGYNVLAARHYSFRGELLKQFHTSLKNIHHIESSERVLINFGNGTLEVLNGNEKLREFRKDDALLYKLPFDYDETAICPMFDKYLSRVLADSASRDVLAEFFGWLFLKDLKLEKALILFGEGQNGKSVLFDIINTLLGDQNVTNFNLSSLTKMENRFRLKTALLNFGSEINGRCDFDVFKQMASGERIESRRLYNDPEIMCNYARLAFNANVLPRDTEQSKGFFRRFLIVPFSETISDAEKDPDLARKIISSELPGVFNWVMSGLRRLRVTRKFSECLAAEKVLLSYRMESDSVAMFLDETELHWSLNEKITKENLYEAYRKFCLGAKYDSVAKNEFGRRLLRDHHFGESKSGNFRYWHPPRRDPGVTFAP